MSNPRSGRGLGLGVVALLAWVLVSGGPAAGQDDGTPVSDKLDGQGPQAFAVANVSGAVLDPRGQGIAGVVLAGFPANTVTDEDGHYQTQVSADWQGVVTPQHPVLVFSPSQRPYDVHEAALHGQDYLGVIEGSTPVGSLQVYQESGGAPAGDYLGLLVATEGIVYVAPGTLSYGGGYIQSTDGGINYYFDQPIPALQVGDRIRLTGYVWYDGNAEIYVGQPSLEVLGHDAAPLPRAAAIDQLVRDYGSTGSFIETMGLVTEKGTLPGETFEYVRLQRNGESIVVYNDPDTGVDFDDLDVGESWSVRGPCTKKLDGLRLVPRFQADLQEIDAGILHVAMDGVDQPDGGSYADPLRTIQYAIDLAVPDDEICVLPGTYTGPGNRDLDLAGKRLLLRSYLGDPATCIIDCEGSASDPHRGFWFHSNEDSLCVVRGFTIRNGYSATAGGAVHLVGGPAWSGAAPSFFDCRFEANVAAQFGGAISCGDGQSTSAIPSPKFVRCTFLDNTAGTAGGAVYGNLWCSPDFEDCDFRGNSATKGGAIRLASYGAGLLSLLRDCRFRDNQADDGGALHVPYEFRIRLENCTFVGNVAQRGGAYCNPGGHSSQAAAKQRESWNVAFAECVFDSNQAVQGGAIFLRDMASHGVEIAGCRFGANVASAEGGAIYGADGTAMPITGCTFSRNTGASGGAVYAISTGNPSAPVRLASSTFHGNGAADGTVVLRHVNPGTAVHLDECLIASGATGAAVFCDDLVSPVLQCCDLYGNAGGDWVGVLASQLGVGGNISADPLFCDPDQHDFALAADSPCRLEANPDCGQIGAWGVGCPAEDHLVARLEALTVGGEIIACGETAAVRFHYTPGTASPAMRGYSVRVVASSPATFTPADFTVATVPAGAQVVSQVTQNAPNDCTVDYTILGAATPGLTVAADLFTILFHGAVDGIASVAVAQVDFRDLQNQSFPVEAGVPAVVRVECGPPSPVGAVTAEPGHRKVRLNWTDPADLDLAAIKVLRGMWQDQAGGSAYPLYGRLAGSFPSRPGSLAEALADGDWTAVAQVAPGAGTYTDNLKARGIYFYEIFAVDDVGMRACPPRRATGRRTTGSGMWLRATATGTSTSST